MAVQKATTGELENAQRVVISKARYVMEHSMPSVSLVEKMTMGQGERAITIPHVAQMDAVDLTDGVDITDSEAIGMTTEDLSTGEVGLKVILTDKLARQQNESVFKIVGRQMGDAMARKKDRDVIALFVALNSGTPLGADDKYLTAVNAGACIARAKADKYPQPIHAVHHPNAIFWLTRSLGLSPASTYPMPSGPAAALLKDFFAIKLSQVLFFEDGNIDVISGLESGYGAIFSKAAMAVVDQKGFSTERERDASLRATEIVVTADYGCWEINDGYGAALQYEIGNPDTDA